jgi:hypothetical protein
VRGGGADAGVPAELVELDGEQDVGGLGLAVGAPLVVALPPVDVVSVSSRGHHFYGIRWDEIRCRAVR